MEIRIVGAIHDEAMLDDLQDIAKVFVYEQRMKQYSTPKPQLAPVKDNTKVLRNIVSPQQPTLKTYLSNVKVKGLI